MGSAVLTPDLLDRLSTRSTLRDRGALQLPRLLERARLATTWTSTVTLKRET